MAWKTPFPPSRMPASVEFSIKLVVCPFGRFCFCSLHASDRGVGEANVSTGNFHQQGHLGLDEAFAQVQSENGSDKVGKPVGFHGFECCLFSKRLNQNATRPREPAIDRVVHEVWPDLDQTAQLEPQAEIWVWPDLDEK